MKGISKRYKIACSAAWLIYFAVLTLSVNFLHHHPEEETACRNPVTRELCKHTSHFSRNYSECWVCAAHFQQEGEQASANVTEAAEILVLRLIIGDQIQGYIYKPAELLLRGPPIA